MFDVKVEGKKYNEKRRISVLELFNLTTEKYAKTVVISMWFHI